MLTHPNSTTPVSIHSNVWDSAPDWRPYSFRWYIFLPVLLVHIGQAVVTALVLAAQYKGSTLFHFDVGDAASYYLWQYVPLTTVVCTSLVWEIIYIDVCRLEPFFQMSQPEGAKLKTSLSQDYLTSFTWFVPYRAYRDRHPAVVLGSLLYILVSMLLPTTTAALIKIEFLFPTSRMLVVVSLAAAVLNAIVLLATIICGVWLFILLSRRRTGVFSDPGGISGIAALTSGSNMLEEFRKLRSYDSQARIDKILGNHRLCLVHSPEQSNPYQICLGDDGNDETLLETVPTFNPRRAEAHSWWLWGRTYVMFYILIVALTLALHIIARRRTTTMSINVSKGLLTIVNVSTAALFSNWHMNVAILEPYYRLASGKTTIQGSSAVHDPYCRIDPQKYRTIQGSSNALHLNFTTSALSNVFVTMRKRTRSAFVGFIALCTLVFQFSIITNPAFINLSGLVPYLLGYSAANGGPSTIWTLDSTVASYGMLVDWWASVSFVCFQALIFLVQLVLMLCYKRRPFLPRKPYTLSSTILYLCHSEGLLQDLEGLSCATKKARDWRLERDGRTYGLGWIQHDGDQCCHVGIERLENIEAAFTFGKALLEHAR